MKIKFVDSNILDIYVKKYLIENVNFESKEEIEKYLKSLFKLLNLKYDITVEGFYDVDIYIDKYYGIIIHMEKEDLDYYNYFKNKVDMKLQTINTDFLYRVDDIPLIDNVEIIIKNNNIYLKIISDLTNLDMMKLIEFSSEICVK